MLLFLISFVKLIVCAEKDSTEKMVVVDLFDAEKIPDDKGDDHHPDCKIMHRITLDLEEHLPIGYMIEQMGLRPLFQRLFEQFAVSRGYNERENKIFRYALGFHLVKHIFADEGEKEQKSLTESDNPLSEREDKGPEEVETADGELDISNAIGLIKDMLDRLNLLTSEYVPATEEP